MSPEYLRIVLWNVIKEHRYQGHYPIPKQAFGVPLRSFLLLPLAVSGSMGL